MVKIKNIARAYRAPALLGVRLALAGHILKLIQYGDYAAEQHNPLQCLAAESQGRLEDLARAKDRSAFSLYFAGLNSEQGGIGGPVHCWLDHFLDHIGRLRRHRRCGVDNVVKRARGMSEDGIERRRGGEIRYEGEGDLVLPVRVGRDDGISFWLGSHCRGDGIACL